MMYKYHFFYKRIHPFFFLQNRVRKDRMLPVFKSLCF